MTDMTATFQGLAIRGKRLASADGKTAPAYNPATGDVIAQVAQATAADVDSAVKTAHSTYRDCDWKQIRTRERGQILQRIANLVRE